MTRSVWAWLGAAAVGATLSACGGEGGNSPASAAPPAVGTESSGSAGAAIPGQGTWERTLQPRDYDGDGVPDAFYDTDLKITWLADAGLSGELLPADAQGWPRTLFIGDHQGWRLPTVSLTSSSDIVPGTSELEHMYSVTLGNQAGGTFNSGPFRNLENVSYTTNRRFDGQAPGRTPWLFDMSTGLHTNDSPGPILPHDVWAVHDGDLRGPHAPTTYSVTVLLTDSPSVALAINNAGQVTGVYVGPEHAFLYSRGVVKDLGTLGGPYSQGRGINAGGSVTGYSHTIPDDFRSNHAFLYSKGAMKDLGTLGGLQSFGLAINNACEVVGYSNTFGDDPFSEHAFLYSNGAMTDLGTLGGSISQAFGINDAGHVTGWAQTPTNAGTHAFLFDGRDMTDLGTLGGRQSQGLAINNADRVTGWSLVPGDTNFHHAFLYRDGIMTDIGVRALESDGFGINNVGQVVGAVRDRDLGSRAFVYCAGVMVELDGVLDPITGPGWRVSEAHDINDAGQIVAFGCNDDEDVCRSLLLTPLP